MLLPIGVVAFVGLSLANTIVPRGIVLHHSAVPAPPNGDYAQFARYLTRIHRARGYGLFYWGRIYNLGYHYLILPDGTVIQGRPDRARGAHARGYNSYIGICLVGDFSTLHNPDGATGPREPTPAQIQSLVELASRLKGRYSIAAEKILLHRDIDSQTECPGDRFPASLFQDR